MRVPKASVKTKKHKEKSLGERENKKKQASNDSSSEEEGKSKRRKKSNEKKPVKMSDYAKGKSKQ